MSLGCMAQLNRLTFQEVDSLSAIEPKPVVVFMHTHWCSYCAAMEQTTLQDEEVIELLNKAFYFISFDAESTEDVTFQSHHFKFRPSGYQQGVHELALELGEINGKLSYPTTCFLNGQFEITYQHNQLMNKEQLLMLLNQIKSAP